MIKRYRATQIASLTDHNHNAHHPLLLLQSVILRTVDKSTALSSAGLSTAGKGISAVLSGGEPQVIRSGLF
jgi:hypothetical protein